MTELDQLREQCRNQEIMLRTLWVQNARLKSKNARLTAEVCKKQRKTKPVRSARSKAEAVFRRVK